MNFEETQSSEGPDLQIRRRNGFIAFIFALLFPGLGQIYNGQLKKAIVFFVLVLIFPISYGLLRTETSFYELLILIIVQLFIQFSVIVDAVIQARRQKEFIPKKYNTWYFYLLIAFSITTVIWFIDFKSILGIQSVHIPTSSNEPTVMIGDNIIVDTKIYNHKNPEYCDLVVFKQLDGYTYNFRVIGKPNDRIRIKNNFLIINDIPCKYRFIEKTRANDFPIFGAINLKFEEEFPDGKKHNIYKLEAFYDSTMTNFENIVVPSDSYFLLGDNRDNAADSRYFGFVRRDAIVGQMIFTLWGKSNNRINVDFRKN
ncbi:MAG: signal peptidase I [Bacteroidota bacterium]